MNRSINRSRDIWKGYPSHYMTTDNNLTPNQVRNSVINRLPKPKIVWLEGWEEQELFSDGLDEGF